MIDVLSLCTLLLMTVVYCLSVGKGCPPLTTILSPVWTHYTQYCIIHPDTGSALVRFYAHFSTCQRFVSGQDTIKLHWSLLCFLCFLISLVISKDTLEVTVCMCTCVCLCVRQCVHGHLWSRMLHSSTVKTVVMLFPQHIDFTMSRRLCKITREKGN